MKRKIVRIDEEKCNGCGQCITSCAEGAIQLIDGKARLVKDQYCDGLGACLGTCPQDAITVEEREAEPFDEHAAMAHVEQMKRKPRAAAASEKLPCGCPGTAARQIRPAAQPAGGCPGSRARTMTPQAGGRPPMPAGGGPSELVNWPVQLKLVGVHAPYFQGADLLLVADCVPFAFPDFHARFLRGKPVVIACPKLDEGQDEYVEKLAAILSGAGVKSLTVVHMEVPCCHGLTRLAQAALMASGASVPFSDVTIGIDGGVRENSLASVR